MSVFAQKEDSALIGSAYGQIWDSIHNYALSPATVAIYKGSVLISYQLTNSFGKYHFDDLPVGTHLVIKASFVGYEQESRSFVLSKEEKAIDLKRINLARSDGTLPEVIVKAVPPVSLNGDTLEFNADAFKIYENAVAEDLLRRLPGVIIWGDGTITVNGKMVSSVLVEGKPFFIGDARIATQNIPKAAIDKIQIYRKSLDKNNPFDSTTEMNIKLKANKKLGYFGKADVGYGTRKSYESDLNGNYFNPNTQISLVGTFNNINKIANNIDQVMLNSTYKGVGANIDYHPDFTMGGTNKFTSAGMLFNHDLKRNTLDDRSNLGGNYYFTNNNNNTINTSQTLSSIGNDSAITQKNYNRISSADIIHTLNMKYEIITPKYEMTTVPSLVLHNSRSNFSGNVSSMSNINGLQSLDSSQSEQHGQDTKVALNTIFKKPKRNTYNFTPGEWIANYHFQFEHDNEQRMLKSNFISLVNPTQDQYIDRAYNNINSDMEHYLDLQFGNLSPLLFGSGNFLSAVVIQIENESTYSRKSQNSIVKDKDPATDIFGNNPYLTNDSKYSVLDDKPSINLSKTFTNSLLDRYKRDISVSTSFREQLYSSNNRSTHDFQNYRRNYRSFIPSVTLKYDNNEYGYFEDIFTVNYSESLIYPSPEQLYPLVDSSNPYVIQEGNANLRSSRKRVLSFSFGHSGHRPTKAINYQVDIAAGLIDRYFADSAVVNESGSYHHYTINLNGSDFLDLKAKLNKNFKLNKLNQLQMIFTSGLEFSKIPGYIQTTTVNQSALNSSSSISEKNSLSLIYSYRDLIMINAKQDLYFFHTAQSKVSNMTLYTNSARSILSASFNCTRSLNIASDVTYNRYNSTGSTATNYTIWNASASYRFTRQKDVELKLSALDLLHQNKSIANSGSNYSITHSTVNVLQQYFMLTLAYYPKKFGRNN